MEDYLKHAMEELANVRPDDVFIVRDLWVGHIWNRMAKADRLLLGRLFHYTVTQMSPCPVEILEKTSDKQQKYRKKATTV